MRPLGQQSYSTCVVQDTVGSGVGRNLPFEEVLSAKYPRTTHTKLEPVWVAITILIICPRWIWGLLQVSRGSQWLQIARVFEKDDVPK